MSNQLCSIIHHLFTGESEKPAASRERHLPLTVSLQRGHQQLSALVADAVGGDGGGWEGGDLGGKGGKGGGGGAVGGLL